MGAAIATAISYFIIMVVRMFDVCRFIEIGIDYKKFWFQFILVSVSALISCSENCISIDMSIVLFLIICLSDVELLKKCTMLIKDKFKG